MSRIERGAIKKIAKSIKLNYILNVAIQDYASRNKMHEIDVIESALNEFFQAKEENRKLDYLIQLAEIANTQSEKLIINTEKIIGMAE